MTTSNIITLEVDAMVLTLSLLEEISGLKSEIRAKTVCLQREMSDSTNNTDNGLPRLTRPVKEYTPAHLKKIDNLRQDIEKKQHLVDAAEKAIVSVQDSQLRAILTLRYIEGQKWADVAKSIYKKASADSVRKRVARYFGKK